MAEVQLGAELARERAHGVVLRTGGDTQPLKAVALGFEATATNAFICLVIGVTR